MTWDTRDVTPTLSSRGDSCLSLYDSVDTPILNVELLFRILTLDSIPRGVKEDPPGELL
jgi:hypothetical protein